MSAHPGAVGRVSRRTSAGPGSASCCCSAAADIISSLCISTKCNLRLIKGASETGPQAGRQKCHTAHSRHSTQQQDLHAWVSVPLGLCSLPLPVSQPRWRAQGALRLAAASSSLRVRGGCPALVVHSSRPMTTVSEVGRHPSSARVLPCAPAFAAGGLVGHSPCLALADQRPEIPPCTQAAPKAPQGGAGQPPAVAAVAAPPAVTHAGPCLLLSHPCCTDCVACCIDALI